MKCFSVKSSVQSQVVCVRSSVSAGGRSENLGVHAYLVKTFVPRLFIPGNSFTEEVQWHLFLRRNSYDHQQSFYYQTFSFQKILMTGNKCHRNNCLENKCPLRLAGNKCPKKESPLKWTGTDAPNNLRRTNTRLGK